MSPNSYCIVPLDVLRAQEFLFYFHEVFVRLKYFSHNLQNPLHSFVCQFVIVGACILQVQLQYTVWGTHF